LTDNELCCNEEISSSKMLVINENGQNLGVMTKINAQKAADFVNLDLVEVTPDTNPPVCRIMDYGKFKYERGKSKKQPKVLQTKEIRLSPKISDHDIDTKTKMAKRFLDKRHVVCFKLIYKRRENAHKSLGVEVMNRVIATLKEVSLVEKTPKLDGNMLTCVIRPL